MEGGAPRSPGEWSESTAGSEPRAHGVRRVQVLDDGGSCVYDRVWSWDTDVTPDRVANFVQTLRQFGKEVDGGGARSLPSPLSCGFLLHAFAVVACSCFPCASSSCVLSVLCCGME